MQTAGTVSVRFGVAVVAIALAFHGVGCAGADTVTGDAGAAGAVGSGGAAANGKGGTGGGGVGSGTAGAGGSLGTGTAGATGSSGTSGASGGGRGGGTAGAAGTAGAGGAGGSASCEPSTNAGCAVGTKCTLLQTPTGFALGCGSQGSKAVGATCTQTGSGQTQSGDDCAAGLACVALQGETAPICRQFCTASGATGACPTGMTCSLQINDVPGTSFCRETSSCTLVPQTGCPAGQACYVVPTGATCAPAGRASPGAACASANDCVPGSTCITTNGASSCASFCSLGGGAPACAATGTGGATCTPPPGTPPEAGTGICR
jgi:hypothetical protein